MEVIIMTNALDFFNRKNLLDYMSDWFGDLKMIPLNFTNSPKVNVKETDKAYEIEIANPGFSKDETKIEVKDGIIYVSMTSENNDEDENSKYHCKQWSKSSYKESWNLPDNVIEDQISAKNNDGVLIITLPKNGKEQKKEETRSITIE